MSATVGDGSQERNGQVENGIEHVAIWVGDSYEDETPRQVPDDRPGPSALVKTGRDEETQQLQENYAGPVGNGERGTVPSIGGKDSFLRFALFVSIVANFVMEITIL